MQPWWGKASAAIEDVNIPENPLMSARDTRYGRDVGNQLYFRGPAPSGPWHIQRRYQ
jgi:hypothetical protein